MLTQDTSTTRSVPSGPFPVLDAEAVAARLGWSRSTFLRRRNALVAGEGFPPELPGRRSRWSAEAVDRWFATYEARRARAAELAATRPTSAVHLHVSRARLEAAYGRADA